MTLTAIYRGAACALALLVAGPDTALARQLREEADPGRVRLGAKLVLRNPRTGERNEPARVVAIHRHKSSGAISVAVLFRDGTLTHGPLARIRIESLPFGSQRRLLRAFKNRIRDAVSDELGLDARQVPLYTVKRAVLKELSRHRDDPFPELAGVFNWGGRALASRDLAFTWRQMVAHEVVHGLSEIFSRYSSPELYEGLTEYFSMRVAIRRLEHAGPDKHHAYYPRYLFALRLAELVGEHALHRTFFTTYDYDAPGELARQVDHALGRPRAFKAALSALERTKGRDARQALRLLGGPPRTDNPWR
ncbi:MAG: hypothetical protein IT371_20515 [Deltaproteobacteria bacterium]|nr:hypothetical protein [Deltaproteobacteria bacterium]